MTKLKKIESLKNEVEKSIASASIHQGATVIVDEICEAFDQQCEKAETLLKARRLDEARLYIKLASAYAKLIKAECEWIIKGGWDAESVLESLSPKPFEGKSDEEVWNWLMGANNLMIFKMTDV